MATPNKKLAESLDELKKLQEGGRRVFRSDELSRIHRERLLVNGFLKAVMKGWLISASPSAREGDSTSWYASFWEFCARYCNARFGNEWHLSAEQSLLLHGENTVIPEQVVVYSPKGTNNRVNLLFGTSLYDLKQSATLTAMDLVVMDGLRLFSAAAALVRVPESFFSRNPIETLLVLSCVADAADILRRLLNGGHSAKAGQLAGAFRRIRRAELAEEIINVMKTAGYDVRESDPFEAGQTVGALTRTTAPIVGRIQMMWESMRGFVMDTFPKAPGLPKDKDAYLHLIDEIYESDAYHSLSIEGYSVTSALIERVRCRDIAIQRICTSTSFSPAK